MILDADALDATQTYKLLIATVVPRAIGWISTLSKDGIPNLAPFSFFTVVGRRPPLLSISMQRKSDGVTLKDTLVNIRDTGEFVTNLVTVGTIDAMHRTAIELPPEKDEFDATGLEKAPSIVVKPPRVAVAPISMECVVHRIFTVGEIEGQEDHVVWGRVVRYHVRDDVWLEADGSTRPSWRPSADSPPSTRSSTTCSRRLSIARSSKRRLRRECTGSTADRANSLRSIRRTGLHQAAC